MTELPAAFAAALAADREALNARYAWRVRSGARIDGDAFLEHLRRDVAPLIEQVHAKFPERTPAVLTALYDVSLDLFAASLLGPEAKMPWMQLVWRDLLPASSGPLVRQPREVAGRLCNAAANIASQPGARPADWIERMREAAPHCQTPAELLEAGKAAAWLAGVVQYRAAALEALAALPSHIAAAVLGRPESTAKVETIVGRLRDHLWLTVEAARQGRPPASLSFAKTAGAFSGFGGPFFRPPSVATDGRRLLVSDGEAHWELLADAYGAWFRRDEPAKKQSAPAATPVASIDNAGTIHWGKQSLAAPHLAGASSFASCGQTLAVTIPMSHHVFLFTSFGSSG